MVSIAQLVEHQTVALRVVGSSPTVHPKFYLLFFKKKYYKYIIPLLILILLSIKDNRDMAQLVAHSLWERGVVSSSLAIPTIFSFN